MNRLADTGRIIKPLWVLIILMGGGLYLRSQIVPLRELKTAQQVRQLTPEQATSHHPVKLRAVITFFDPSQYYQFLQDDTAGIYFSLDGLPEQPPLAAGQLVEITGEADPGEY